MFEAELELEKRSSSLGPLLLVVSLLVAIIGSLGYFMYQRQNAPTTAQAEAAVTDALNARGPGLIHFHVGLVKPTADENPADPHYLLLEKAGIVKLDKQKDGSLQVTLIDGALKSVENMPRFKKITNPDGTAGYFVPLADREILKIEKPVMLSQNTAEVNFSWNWHSTPIGDNFDAAGPLLKSFGSWERMTLIEKYGADFFHGQPHNDSLKLVRDDGTWKLSAE